MKKIILLFAIIAPSIFADITETLKKSQPEAAHVTLDELKNHYNNILKTSGENKTLTTQEALDFLIKTQDVVMIKFFAPWCGPCRSWGPIVKNAAAQSKQININGKSVNVTVVEINIDQFRSITGKYNVSSIPTAIYYAKGKIIDRSTGALPLAKTVEKIKNAAEKAA